MKTNLVLPVFGFMIFVGCASGQAQSLPVTYTGASPLKFTIDSNAQVIDLGSFDGRTTLSQTYSTLNLNSAATGAGARMVWYPGKAAFRAGYVNGTQWDDANIGVGSVAFGLNNENGSDHGFMAGSGNSSLPSWGNNVDGVAFGSNNVLYGASSIAMGAANTTTTDFTISIGENNMASGYYSSAIGQFNTSTNKLANAFGCGLVSSGYGSTALGYYNQSLADHASALGDHCAAESFAETVVGSYNSPQQNPNPTSWVPTDELFVVGNGSAQTGYSNALVISKNGNATFQGTVMVKAGGDIPMYKGN